MKIQVITYNGNSEKFDGPGVTESPISNIKQFDDFNVNVIDLNQASFWECRFDSNVNTVKDADFASVKRQIESSRLSSSIVMLPKDYLFKYKWSNLDSRYQNGIRLKNHLTVFSQKILSRIFDIGESAILVYGETSTDIGEYVLNNEFMFANIQDPTDKFSEIKSTGDKVILTTCLPENYNHLIAFIKYCGLMPEEKGDEPEWFKEVQMFDDQLQLDKIGELEVQKREINEDIEKANEVLEENKRFKSILYSQGDYLVEVLLEILEEMLGCDLSQFVDNRKEDFRFEIDGTTFIGEVKGVAENVKKKNVNQLDDHCEEYLEQNSSLNKVDIKGLLIMNHQRNKPLEEREPVNEEIEKHAERDGYLIIETITFLRVFEKYRNGEKTREEIIDILKNETGLLKLNEE